MAATSPLVDVNVVDNIRVAYHQLHRSVIRAIQTQVGDAARLAEQRQMAMRLFQTAEPVSLYFSLHLIRSHLYLRLLEAPIAFRPRRVQRPANKH